MPADAPKTCRPAGVVFAASDAKLPIAPSTATANRCTGVGGEGMLTQSSEHATRVQLQLPGQAALVWRRVL